MLYVGLLPKGVNAGGYSYIMTGSPSSSMIVGALMSIGIFSWRGNMYIQSASLNRKPLNNCWFSHEVYAKGGLLEFWLRPNPNKKWGMEVLPEQNE